MLFCYHKLEVNINMNVEILKEPINWILDLLII